MEKRDNLFSNSKLEEIKHIRVTLLKAVKMKVIGKVTGKEYLFSGAGACIYVDEKDEKTFTDRAIPISCCGSVGSPYFEIERL